MVSEQDCSGQGGIVLQDKNARVHFWHAKAGKNIYMCVCVCACVAQKWSIKPAFIYIKCTKIASFDCRNCTKPFNFTIHIVVILID